MLVNDSQWQCRMTVPPWASLAILPRPEVQVDPRAVYAEDLLSGRARFSEHRNTGVYTKFSTAACYSGAYNLWLQLLLLLQGNNRRVTSHEFSRRFLEVFLRST